MDPVHIIRDAAFGRDFTPKLVMGLVALALAGPTPGAFAHASTLVTMAALAFDVVVEIAMAYLPYLALPVMFGLLNDPRPLPPRPPRAAPTQSLPGASGAVAAD